MLKIYIFVLCGLVILLLVIPAPALSQSMEQHIHPSLKVIMNGQAITLPGNIGIDPHLWLGHSLDNYSIAPKILAPIHTHKDNDTLHVESTVFRRFTFGDFLYVWGIDQSKITRVTSNGKEIENYKTLPLTDGQNLTLQISLDTSPKDFNDFKGNYNSTVGLAFRYPSEWKVNPTSTTNEPYIALVGEKLLSRIELFPPERNYLNAPYFEIEVDKLPPSSNITLDQYTKKYMSLVLQGNEITFFKVNYNDSLDYTLNGNPAQKLLLEESYINVNKTNDIIMEDNPTYPIPYMKTMYIWTIKNDKIYILSYNGYSYQYSKYFPTIDKIVNSTILD